MVKKVRVGAVSYLNTKPLIYGFEHGKMEDKIELVMDYPAKIAAALLNNEIDLGLVPVAILPEMKEYYIIGNHCIGAEGAVASVCIFSEVAIEQVETVLLDYQSRTSVKLARVLMKEFWKINPILKSAGDDFRQQIAGTTAAVVIGDRALEQREISAYHYDLGLAWKQLTGLPFVFAAWISNKPLSNEFVDEFNKVNAIGFKHIDEIVRLSNYSAFDLKRYYSACISYNLTEEKEKGLRLFLEKIK